MRRALISVLGCAVLSAVLTAQVAGVQVHRQLDRTAVWVGDSVVYTLEFTSTGDFDVLAEDLAPERLPIKNAEAVHQESTERDTRTGRVRVVTYRITTIAVGAPEIVIESFPVRYFSRRAVGETQVAPAGQVSVPRTVIPIRSTLPDSGRLPELREPSALRTAPAYLRLARPLGLALIAIAAIPVALMLVDVAGYVRRVRAGTPRRQARRAHAEAFEDLRTRHPESVQEQAEAFERLDYLVRDHLTLTTGIEARALTPVEIASAMRSRAGMNGSADSIETLLSLCERARYAPDRVAADAWRTAIDSAGPVLKTRRL